MPSTYTVNLGIEKPATGEQSGTWGNTTNTNFDILDQAINGVLSLTLASAGSSGSPNILAIDNGAISNGRNKWIEFVDGGDLGANAFVRLDPNDAEKVVFFRNSLSGSRSVFVFQGTYNASNDFEIPSGVDVVLKFDGAGTGAVVTDVFRKLRVTELTTPTFTATSVDINGGTIDGTSIGTASASTGNFTTMTVNAGTASVPSITTAGDANTGVYFPAADNISLTTSGTQRVTLDSSGRLGLGTGSPVGKFQVNDGAGRNVIVTTDATQIGTSGMAVGSFNDNASAYAPLTLLGSALHLATGGLERARIDSSGNLGIGTTTPTAYGGKLNVYGGDIVVADITTSSGASSPRIGSATQALVFKTNSGSGSASEAMRIDGLGNLGIGTSAPSGKLEVRDTNATGVFSNSSTRYGFVQWENTGGEFRIGTDGAFGLRFDTNAQRKMTIDSSGNLGVGDTPPPNTTYPGLFLQNSVGLIPYNGDGYLFYNAYSVGTNQLRYRSSGLAATAYAFNQSGEHIWYNAPSGTAGTAVTFSERMRITSSGNLGIGTSSPGARFHVSGGSILLDNNTNISIKTNSGSENGILTFNTSDQLLIGGGGATNAIQLWTAGVERARIDSSGNFGIGVSNPTSKLQIGGSGNIKLNGGAISFDNPINNRTYSIAAVNSGSSLVFNDTSAGAERMRLDSAGNLGLGVTPSAWNPGQRAIQVGAYAAFRGDSATTGVNNNAYYNSASQWIYQNTNFATRYEQNSGNHFWLTAPSGTEGNAITFTQAMTLDSSGRLGIGTTSPVATLHVTAAGGTSSGTLSLSPTSALGSNPAYLIMGNSDSGGVAGPTVISSANRELTFSLGDSFSSSSGGTLTTLMKLDANGRLGIGTTSPTYPADVTKTGSQVGATTGYMVGSFRDASPNKGVSLGYDSGSQTGIVLAQSDSAASNLAFWTWNGASWAERARISSGGNLGIGTSSPTYKLTISGAAGDPQILSTDGNVRSYIAYPSGSGTSAVNFIGTDSAHAQAFITSNTERARITSGGDFLVGTTATTGSQTNTKNAVVGKITSNNGSLEVAHNTATTMLSVTAAGASTFLVTVTVVSADTGSNYTVLGLLRCGGATDSYTNILTAAFLTVSLSGTNLQVTQTSGTLTTVEWSLLRLL
jgi:hypothetical protein